MTQRYVNVSVERVVFHDLMRSVVGGLCYVS